MKTIAFYLPQFHQLPENDRWWGEGFTEWTAVKKATPLFSGHIQPRIPLNNNYYDLLRRNTMEWQAQVAQRNGIGGFCFYHYWFKDGQRILERPAENLLQWKDVDMPFCFCWANEPWARSWSKLSTRNFWSSKFEIGGQSSLEEPEILLDQEYGGSKEWEVHFDYLLPFFTDERYIKIDGKPVFLCILPYKIPNFALQVSQWRTLAERQGLPGLYIIGMSQFTPGVDAMLLYEPRLSFIPKNLYDKNTYGKKEVYDYDRAWEENLNRKYEEDKKIYFSGFVDFDSTPRHGENGQLFHGASPEKFQGYFERLVQKSLTAGSKLVFINAWNEWGEGMYLEPDTHNGYGYLAAVKSVMDKYATVNVPESKNKKNCLPKGWEHKYEKYINYINLFDKWLILKEKGLCISDYLQSVNYCSVAIYGCGMAGRHLLEELKSGAVEIKYIIDQNKNVNTDMITYGLEDEWPEVDAIIISIVHDYDKVWQLMKSKTQNTVIWIEELIAAIGGFVD